jgi:hypothetical protein
VLATERSEVDPPLQAAVTVVANTAIAMKAFMPSPLPETPHLDSIY